MNAAVKKLINHQHLSSVESQSLFSCIVGGELNDIELTAALVAWRFMEPHADEVAGAATALLNAATPFPEVDAVLADNCGTGGDGSHSINVSTAAAVVAASAGVKVAKHGNRSVSSQCGSADLLKAFGIQLDMPPDQATACLRQHGICFLFAPSYHRGIKHAMPVRTALKTRTLFNMLGPLVNPARPRIQLCGVFSPHIGPVMARALSQLGVERGLVVHGDGLDEIAVHAPTRAWRVEDPHTRPLTITPESVGLRTYPLHAIRGGDPILNFDLLCRLFSGRGDDAHRAVVAINAGALIWLSGVAKTHHEGVACAMDILSSDRCMQIMANWAGAGMCGHVA